MNHARHHGMLCMGAHHESKQHDDQSWYGVERELVCVGSFGFVCFFDRVRALGLNFVHGCVEKIANTCRLDEHTALKKQVSFCFGKSTGADRGTYQASSNEQNCDGDVLHVLGGPVSSPTAEVLHEDIGSAIEEDQEALDELSGRAPLLGVLPWSNIPCPAKLSKAASPATEGEDT